MSLGQSFWKRAKQIAKTAGGAAVGLVTSTVEIARDVGGLWISPKEIEVATRKIEQQGEQYRELVLSLRQFRDNPRPVPWWVRFKCWITRRSVTPSWATLDSVVVGGETLAAYVSGGSVPHELQRAFELQYPREAMEHGFADQVRSMNDEQLLGFVSGVKGKLFELRYVDYLNDGNLPDGFHAELARSANNPGWDIGIIGPDGAMKEAIQLKATDSVTYIKDAIQNYPDIDVVTTSEVHSHLVMQGFAERVVDSGIADSNLTDVVTDSIDGSAISMDWVPSPVSFAIIAFTAYNQDGLSEYQKGDEIGKRSAKSYLAYIAGGVFAVATQTWWLGVLGGVGTRLVLGSGRTKREKLTMLRDLARNNQQVLDRLQRILARE